ncbi:MAG TPA: hypothetical protein VFJ51_04605 [Nitrososphaeraceae archaeon]|nr:hypothetical protein [Nitrososphaeraceae archaeon]
MTTAFEEVIRNKLEVLVQTNKISQEQLSHFLRRGIQVISPKHDFGLDSLHDILPEIVIGASKNYINKMKVPYQTTSFIAANTRKDMKGAYIFKIPNQPSGGIKLLTGGKRKKGDNVFASVHRIILGQEAIMVSAVNLMANKDKIWNWKFFGDHLKNEDGKLYEDLIKLNNRISGSNKTKYYIVVCRSDATFKRLNMLEEFKNKKIAVLDPKNDMNVIFLTNIAGYEYGSKTIPESDRVDYLVTGSEFDIYQAMLVLRKKYKIQIILNDGGRQLSNGIRDAGLLGEERVTLEPYPGDGIIPDQLDPTSIMGLDGIGIDGKEIEKSILLSSIKINSNDCGKNAELANVYVYYLDEKKVL